MVGKYVGLTLPFAKWQYLFESFFSDACDFVLSIMIIMHESYHVCCLNLSNSIFAVKCFLSPVLFHYLLMTLVNLGLFDAQF